MMALHAHGAGAFDIVQVVIDEETIRGVETVARHRKIIDCGTGLDDALITRHHDVAKAIEEGIARPGFAELLAAPVGDGIERGAAGVQFFQNGALPAMACGWVSAQR